MPTHAASDTADVPRLLPVLFAAALVTACASSGRTARPYPSPHEPSRPAPAAPHGRTTPAGEAVAERALVLIGAPYRDGGTGPTGFDCSGLVAYVFNEAGVAMPRALTDQQAAGKEVAAGDLRPGDLVFFAIDGRKVSHVGILVDGDTFVHAPSSRGQARVRTDRLSTEYWRKRFAGARRIVAD